VLIRPRLNSGHNTQAPLALRFLCSVLAAVSAACHSACNKKV
jgi:hypothetical protein